MATEITLSYKCKLFPTRVKADTLAALVDLFQRQHSVATQLIAAGDRPRLPSCKGLGEFVGRAYRRAHIDYQRTTKAGHQPGTLKAELIDSAEIQHPRKAKSFDLWCMVRGTTATRGKNGGFYIPARKHRALNRTLALPGAQLNESAEIFRKNGKWYARVSVSVPIPEERSTHEWIGVDVGVRTSLTCSDGYRGPDLRPIIKKQKVRQADRQRHLHPADFGLMTPQRQAQAREARRLVSRAARSRRGIALESPDRLPRWKQWAARFLAKRVLLLAALAGVPCALISPPYTSLTCARCGERDSTFRHKAMFRCHSCGFTANADRNASLNIAYRASRVSCESHHSSLRLSPRGGGKVE